MTDEVKSAEEIMIEKLTEAIRAAASDLKPLANFESYKEAGERGPRLIRMIIKELNETIQPLEAES